jgi:hypothetical protein
MVITWLLIFVIFLERLVFNKGERIGNIVLTVSSGLALIAIFVIPLLKFKSEGSYLDKLIPSVKPVEQRSVSELLMSARHWDYIVIFIFLSIIVVVCPLCFYGGVSDAGKQQWFHVIKQPSAPESVLIRSYGEYLLAVPFTRITRKNDEDKTPAPFKKELIVVKMSDVKTPLCFESVGPLEPEKPVGVKP